MIEVVRGDITRLEPNIHAGTKYMDQLMTRYFSDANFDDQNRTLFAFASYNAGPGNISRMRKEAAKRGLDPDQHLPPPPEPAKAQPSFDEIAAMIEHAEKQAEVREAPKVQF